ncbi:basic blue protein-like [Phragmites australis]|uniref:basic blue protein-like n=1 Tax=Phragmites australis TaxID=29695 RepID=UPI002D77B806|nr:basic blue protein-like [Phragmites australis]
MEAAVVAVFAADLCTATDHIVGGNHGWNTQHQLLPVSGNQTFYIGDLISFRYQKGTRNVFEVNKTGYDNYTMAGVAGDWASGKDFIQLPEPRRYYFISANGFCQQGMKCAAALLPSVGTSELDSQHSLMCLTKPGPTANTPCIIQVVTTLKTRKKRINPIRDCRIEI